MRVLLVRPPVPRYTVGLRHLMTCEPLELEYVAAGLGAEHDVQILDLLVERGLQSRLRRFRPDVVGTSAYITGVNEARRVCRVARQWDPAVRTVIGGVHAAVAPADFADPAVDAIVLSGDTATLPELLHVWERGLDPARVAGLALPTRAGGISVTAPRPYMVDADAMPLPRRDLVRHLRHHYYYLFHRPLALLKTTWGCWYRCNFCFNWQITGGPAYVRSPESIVRELAALEADEVYIVDDIFLIQPKRLQRLAQLLRAEGIRKRFLCFGRADFVAEHEPIIREWAELGLSAVLIGLEATTDDELASMEKRTSAAQNRRAIEVLRRSGVDVYGSLIPRPDYVVEDWRRLEQFIERSGLYYLNISPLTPLPGTSIWPQYEEQLTVDRRAHALWDLSHVVVPTKMPLKQYYRALLRVYGRAVLNLPRARKVVARPWPPWWSRDQLRVWWGVAKVAVQLAFAHRHHRPAALARAMSVTPPARTAPARATTVEPVAVPSARPVAATAASAPVPSEMERP